MAEDGGKEHGNFDRGFSLVSRTVNDFERSFPRLDSTVASLVSFSGNQAWFSFQGMIAGRG